MGKAIKTVYLAGPMSGKPSANFPTFFRAAVNLRERGYEVVSPAEEDEKAGIIPEIAEHVQPCGRLWVTRLKYDLNIISRVDAVVVLPGWTGSCGAQLEVAVAKILEKPVLKYPSLEAIGV
jgi:uncharacterized protein DUF4406